MNTKEFIEYAAKNPSIFESLRNVNSLEQMYALAKEYGLSDSENDFLEYFTQASRGCAPVDLSALFQVAGGGKNSGDFPPPACDDRILIRGDSASAMRPDEIITRSAACNNDILSSPIEHFDRIDP